MIFVLAMFGLAQAECSLRSLVTTMNLRPGSEASWERTDEWKFDIGSGNVPCRQLELEQIPGVQIVDVRAIIRQTDDSRVVLKADRLEVLPVASLETRTVLHLPELRNRDRLTLRVQRKPHNTAIPIRWRPGWRGAVPSAELVVAGAVDSTAIVAFEDGDSIVLPPAAGMDEPWRWAFSDVPDGHPEPGGSDWLGVEWWVSPLGSLRDLAVAEAKQMTLPAEPLSLEHQDTSWMNNTAAPLRAVHVGPRSLTAQQVWARGWGRPWDTGRAIMQSLGGTKVGFQLGIVRVAGSVQWRESVVVDPAGNVVYASAPDRMLGADAIEVSTGGALSLPAPTARIESCLTGMVLREDGWQVTHAKAEGTRIERLAAGPVSLSALMPALDDREATPRRGRMWTGLPRQFVWTLELPGVVLHQVPVSGGGKGPSTEWSAQCTSDASGSMCDVSFQHDGGWLEPGSVPGLQLVHDAVSEWASQAIEVAR